MFPSVRGFAGSRRWVLWAVAGFALRLVFIVFPRAVDDDTWDYLELGRNLLRHGVYGMGSGTHLSPCLFRLPGYPMVLAAANYLFGGLPHGGWMVALCLFQSIADVGAGVLLALFLRRYISPRAGEVALILAMLCPFTAAEAGIAMTECLSVFAVALGIYAAGRALLREQAAARDLPALVLAGLAGAFAMLLRPDGAILAVALGAAILGYVMRRGWSGSRRRAIRRALVSAAVFSLAALLPISIWTIRNWVTFRVFQPLAPRHLSDPGDRANLGIYRWMRTWTVDYVSTANVFWQVGVGPIDPANLPARAFDSSAQHAHTLALLDEYNRAISVSADLDRRFAALAEERIHAHPLRYYLFLPFARSADMMLRPRTDEFLLDVFWWRWSNHPGQTTAAILAGLLNLFYLAAAFWGFVRRRVPLAWMLGGFIVLRCLLLGNIENSEPRYTMQCFPVFIVAAAAAFAARRNAPSESLCENSQQAPVLVCD